MSGQRPSLADSRGPASIHIQRRIEWSDTDASGHYHNTAAFRLMEAAETLLMLRIGLASEVYGRVPRVHIEADFHQPLWFQDVVDVELAVEEVGTSSIRYEVRILRGGEIFVSGRIVAVLVEKAGSGRAQWTDRQRALLLTSGPQAPELLSSI